MIWFDHTLVLRDIYRLMLMLEYESSKLSVRFHDNAWLTRLHDEFFRAEAAHLLVSIAAPVRRIQDREWGVMSQDERRAVILKAQSETNSVGFYAKNPPPAGANLALRGACNCILHAEHIEWCEPSNGDMASAWRAPYYDWALSSEVRDDGKQFLMTASYIKLTESTNANAWNVVVHLPKFLSAATMKIRAEIP